MANGQGNQRQAILLSYMAGIIDGEGTIRINKANMTKTKQVRYANPKYAASISLGMTDRQIPDLFVEVFGGKTRLECVQGNRKPIYRWGTSGRIGTQAILKQLLPYLRVKRKQAELVIDFCERCQRPYQANLGLSELELRFREDVYQKVRKLNETGAAATTNRGDTREGEVIG